MWLNHKKKDEPTNQQASIRTASTTKLRIYYHLRRTATYWIENCKRCARLKKALALAPESLRFQGCRQIGINTCMANGKNIRGKMTARRNQPSLRVSQVLAPCARQPGFRPRRQDFLFGPKTTLHEPKHALGEPQHISILAAHNIPSESVEYPGQRTTSTEASQVKNPNPMLQYHLAHLHASSRGNDCTGSSDLLYSGGWVPRNYQWWTGGQQGAHAWDHNDGPHGHFHTNCNQQQTIGLNQTTEPNMRLASRNEDCFNYCS